MNILSLSVLATGGILVYCALKGSDPRDLVKAALSGEDMPDVKYDIEGGGAIGELPDVDLFPGDPDILPDIPGWIDPSDILPINARRIPPRGYSPNV